MGLGHRHAAERLERALGEGRVTVGPAKRATTSTVLASSTPPLCARAQVVHAVRADGYEAVGVVVAHVDRLPNERRDGGGPDRTADLGIMSGIRPEDEEPD